LAEDPLDYQDVRMALGFIRLTLSAFLVLAGTPVALSQQVTSKPQDADASRKKQEEAKYSQKFRSIEAVEAARFVNVLLGNPGDAVFSFASSQAARRSKPPGNRMHYITIDEETNTVTVIGRSDWVNAARELMLLIGEMEKGSQQIEPTPSAPVRYHNGTNCILEPRRMNRTRCAIDNVRFRVLPHVMRNRRMRSHHPVRFPRNCLESVFAQHRQ
jgi:hypothetical protein